LLAQAGVEVTRIESANRPDPTAKASSKLDDWLNGRKTRLTLALDDPQVMALIAETDILITSARPHALALKGLTEQRLMSLNPGLIWVAVSAHGWREDSAWRVGFGDDCAAAGGLVARHMSAPRFMGDALADPLTGLEAATYVLEALDHSKAGLVDASLAQTAKHYASQIGVR
jgi:crotonobetainyl-CoA:carnitine CoA-transferase CaiB-like acyl-CoA transferase